MSKQTADLPVFLTRADVANLLRITPRQVDRLAKAGTLNKQKLSASRSGFDRTGIETHLAKLAGKGGNAPASAPASYSDATTYATEYGSPATLLTIDAPGANAAHGVGIDDWLELQGWHGCFVMVGKGRVVIAWNERLNHDGRAIMSALRKALDGVKARDLISA
jgi:hypothetical protein